MNAIQVDALIKELDNIGRDYDNYEYGLPVNNTEQMNLMRDVVWKYIITPPKTA